MSSVDVSSQGRPGVSRPDYPGVIQRYIDLWNLPDDQRAEAIDQLCVADVRYVDPTISTAGRAELCRYIGLTRAHFGGSPFRLVPPVDGHHEQVRFGWECGPSGAVPLASGFDVALLRNGRLAAVHGFFD